MRHAHNPPVLFCDDGSEVALPYRWVICSACEGKGTTTAHVEADGGGITGEEMRELGDEFRADYLRGVYDRPCGSCNGSGKVQVADERRMLPKQRAEYRRQQRDVAESYAIERAERARGA